MNSIEKKIRTAEVNIGISKSGGAWYRGQSKSTWELNPKIFRFGHSTEYLIREENHLFSDFRGDYVNYLPNISERDSWDVLCAMQHYGISTRLLDWSTELNVALYFAIKNAKKIDQQKPETWPCIWVLNPYRLNELFVKDNIIFDRADPLPYDYYEQNIKAIKGNSNWPHKMPLAFNPGFSNPRIQAQHGRFTIHGDPNSSFDAQANEQADFWGLYKVVIDPNDFGQLKKHDVRKPVYHLNMFPDIEGYVSFLNHRAKVR